MFYNQIQPFEILFPNPMYICKSPPQVSCRFFHGDDTPYGCLVSILSFYLLIAKWDLGMTTAVYDGTVSNSCYCFVGGYASHCSAMSSQPV